MRASIPIVLSLDFSRYPYSWAYIGRFFDSTDDILLVQSVQLGALLSFFQSLFSS
jgi:hypothetical protein